MSLGAVGAFAALLAVAAEPPSPAPDAVRAEARFEAPEGGPVTTARLGDDVILAVTMTGPAGWEYHSVLEQTTRIGPFQHVLPVLPAETRAEGTLVHTTLRYRLRPLRIGVERLRELVFPYRRADGTSGEARTRVLRLQVAGRLVNQQDPEPAPPPGGVPIAVTNWPLIWLLVVLGVMAVSAVLALVVVGLMRRHLASQAPAAPRPPANEWARRRLEELRGAAIEPDALLAGVIDTLRAYLGQRYVFEGLELTTRETLAALDGADLKGVSPVAVQDILEDADLVKFARAAVVKEHALTRIDDVWGLVERTWEPPKRDPEEALRRRWEPAPASRRVQAALVDGAVALVLPGVLFGLLLAADQAWFGWVPVLVWGVLLMLRDLMGGGSPGKALLGLRLVERADHRRSPSLGARLGRNLPLIVPLVGIPVELVVMGAHPRRWRLGDQLSSAEVVSTRHPIGADPAQAGGDR
jgi:hypothetical protein